MTIEEIRQAAEEDARFSVRDWSGIAFYFYGEESEADEDTEWTGILVPTGNVLMVMVGDDRKHSVHPDDVTEIPEGSYCPECGQVGCQGGRL